MSRWIRMLAVATVVACVGERGDAGGMAQDAAPTPAVPPVVADSAPGGDPVMARDTAGAIPAP